MSGAPARLGVAVGSGIGSRGMRDPASGRFGRRDVVGRVIGHRENLDAVLDGAVSENQGIIAEDGTHLTHGVAAIGPQEAFHAHRSPPTMLVILSVRSSGISAWDITTS